MKIGLSYSRCVRDIADGIVDIKDVLVVVSRTDFDPRDDAQWKGIWEGYGGGQTFGSPFSNPEWIDYSAEDESRIRAVSIDLWNTGKLHQPRKFGARPRRMNYYWMEVSLSSDDIDSNPTVKKAWEQFQLVAGLSTVGPVDNNF
jgi:hypothetical protein